MHKLCTYCEYCILGIVCTSYAQTVHICTILNFPFNGHETKDVNVAKTLEVIFYIKGVNTVGFLHRICFPKNNNVSLGNAPFSPQKFKECKK